MAVRTVLLAMTLCALVLAATATLLWPKPEGTSAAGTGVAAVAAGEHHTCALMTVGGLKCWGYNFFGQLGNGTTTNSSTPVNVSGLSSGVAAVAAGDNHTCAITTAGGLKCWGKNSLGQLGNGTTTNSSTPVDVSGLTSGVAAVSAGEHHTCAVTTAGGLKCWGNNSLGQLGNGTTTNSSTPAGVSGLSSGVAAVAAGDFHTCALRTAGGLKCWGYNAFGALGNGTATDSSTPVDVSGLSSGVGAVTAGGYHTCALTTAGGLKCWGDNVNGALGNGTTTNSRTPVDVSGLKPVDGPDSDGDGCPDSAEQQTAIDSEVTGGRRDYLNPYDFYDIDGNQTVDLFIDIFGVAFRYGSNDEGGTATINRFSDPDSTPPAAPAYHPRFDRSPPPPGGDAWDMGPPDGTIDLFNDIFGVAFQYGHHCT